jgi:hypothetical protein
MRAFYISAIGLVIALGIAYAFVVQELYDVSVRLDECEMQLGSVEPDILKNFRIGGC